MKETMKKIMKMEDIRYLYYCTLLWDIDEKSFLDTINPDSTHDRFFLKFLKNLNIDNQNFYIDFLASIIYDDSSSF